MLQCFYPDSYQDSAYSIDYEKLRMQGYEAIIYDIDNTLVCHGAPADERSMALIERLKGLGFSIMLLSNNKEPRVKSFNDQVHVSYIYKAGKPNPKIMRLPWSEWAATAKIQSLSVIRSLRISGVPRKPGFIPFW